MNKIISLADLWEIYNLSSHLIAVITPDGKFAQVNPSFTTSLGYWEEELIGKDFEAFIHPADRRNEFASFAEEDKPYSICAMKRLKDSEGAYRFFSWTFSRPAYGPYIYATAQDCSDKVELEQILNVSSLRHGSADGITIVNEHNRIVWANEHFTTLTGYQRHELINKDWMKLLAGPLTMMGADYLREEDLEVGCAVQKEGTVYRRNGQPFRVKIDAQPLLDSHSGVTRWLISLTEIPAKDQGQLILNGAHDFSRLFNNNPLNCLVFDPGSLAILGANEVAIKTYGYSASQFAGKLITDITVANSTAYLDDIILKVLRGEVRNGSCYHRLSNGNIIRVDANFSLTVYKGRKAILAIFKDITIDYLQKQKRADQSDCLRDLAWKQSHLVRSPLANLKALMVFLKEDPNNKTFVNYAQQELERLDKIIVEMVSEAHGTNTLTADDLLAITDSNLN